MSLFYKSKPYRIVAGDAKSGTLSHAYLLVCPDGANLRAFLKELAVLVAGGDERRDRLIREERFADMAVIPAEEGGKIAVGDVRAVIDDAYVNPWNPTANCTFWTPCRTQTRRRRTNF